MIPDRFNDFGHRIRHRFRILQLHVVTAIGVKNEL
jgi:hypothetical protein